MSIISAGTSATNALVNTGDTTGALVFKTNDGTTALTLGTDQSATFAGTVSAAGFSGLPAPRTKVWTAVTATGSYTVPDGVSSIRVYAVGAGGNGASHGPYTGGRGSGGGGGGGCAYGDIAVTAGDTVSITISSGVATVVYGGTTMLTANKGADGTAPVDPNPGYGGAGGTATKHASVTNGGAYTGGTGGNGNPNTADSTNGGSGGGGGSAASPLGNGYAGGVGGNVLGSGAGGGGGIGGAGGAGAVGGPGGGGGAGGAGGAGGSNSTTQAAGGGSGSAASGVTPGAGRAFVSRFTDPLIADCYLGAVPRYWVQSTTVQPIANMSQPPGCGGAASPSLANLNGFGGDFAGGAGGFRGGILGGNGGVYLDYTAEQASYGGGGGGAGAFYTTGSTGGDAIVLIYA